MQTAVINVRLDPKIKKQAQKVADDLGLSLSALVNGFIKNLIKTKEVHFSLSEEPSEYLIKSLKESAEDIKAGRVVSFSSGDQALAYLDRIIEKDERKAKKD
jgi:DNA-damage-inducible protein J